MNMRKWILAEILGLNLLILLQAGFALAWYPALKPGMPLPELRVSDEQGLSMTATGALKALGAGPALLVPLFTRCHTSCPVLIAGLKEAMAAAASSGKDSIHVLILSFDAEETSEDLQRFRKREKIPPHWKVVRAQDQASVREFFDRYSYSIMDSDGGFVHPSQVFVLNARQGWAASLLGPRIQASDVKDAYEKAQESKLPRHPETLLLIGAAGFVSSLTVALFLAIRRRPSLKGLKAPTQLRVE
jgi:cytochrome oxidase Cu insertion factor (SCO1/SenC/PrrC family)